MDSQHLFGTSRDTDSCLLLRAVGCYRGKDFKKGLGVGGVQLQPRQGKTL